jgi:hypothetical protein
MKKLLLLILLTTLISLAGCSKKKESLALSSQNAIESFVTSVKHIEQPASEAFTDFANSLQELNGDDSAKIAHIFDKIATGVNECREAANSFNSLSSSIPEEGVEDTVRIILKGSSIYLRAAYSIRSEAIIEIDKFLTTGNQENFENYFKKVKEAIQESDKAFGAITAARAKAASLE